jgi:ABC-2 type transport system permease protein
MAGIARVSEGATPASPRASGLSDLTVRPRQVGALLWLRWKLGIRAYRRSVSSAIGAIAMAVFILGFGVSTSLLTGFGYLYLPRAAAAQLLFATLTFLYIAWVALPIVQYSVNEGLDVTRLATYPLTRAERMLGLTLATLLDPPTFIITALFVAALVGWGAGPVSIAIGVAALLLLYIHTTGLSQMTVAAMVGMLRSRRYRDLSVVIFALMSVTCSLSGQFATTLLRHADSIDLLGRIDIGRYAQWLPPGMAAQAIILASTGDALGSLPWLLALVALTPVLLAAWAWTLDRGVTSPESAGEGGGGVRRARSVPVQRAGAAVESQQRTRRPWISPVVAAVAVKDLRYLWRDPQIKASLLSSLVLLLVVFAPNLVRGDRPPPQTNYFYEHLAGLTPLLAPLPALLVVLTLSVNALGLERQGLRTLMLFPAKALDILWGKNLAVALVALAAQAALIATSCAVTGFWAAGPLALAEGVAATLTLLGVGNVTSTLLPLRVRSYSVGSSNISSGNGCLRSVISLGALWGTLLTLTPVFILLLMPPLLGRREWLAVSAPLAVLYGLAVYQIATRLIAPWLDKRAPEIVALATHEEE